MPTPRKGASPEGSPPDGAGKGAGSKADSKGAVEGPAAGGAKSKAKSKSADAPEGRAAGAPPAGGDGLDAEALGRALAERAAGAADAAALEAVRIDALGRSGALTRRLRALGALGPEARRAEGAALNRAKEAVAAAVAARAAALRDEAEGAALEAERLDESLPVEWDPPGRIHPVSRVQEEMVDLFAAMGFRVEDGPDIEDAFHSFEALNIPDWHPARQEMDTFYIRAPEGSGSKDERPILRPHTSPAQVRAMLRDGAPLRIVAPGRAFRADSDATHIPMFHQLEALVIEKGIHMGHLRGTIETFVSAFFGRDDIPVRFRASHFPFTEPSAEVDVGCRRTRGRIEIAPGGEWMEILGCGMVHPRVLRACGLDPEEWQGFAWGVGIERMAALKHGAPDLRAFPEGDLDWIRRHGLLPWARASVAWGE